MDSRQGGMQKNHWHSLQLNSWKKLSIPLSVSSNCTAWQRGALEKRKGKKMLMTSSWDISKAITASPLFKKLWNDEQMEMRKGTVEWQRGFSHRLQEQWGMPGRCTTARAESVWSNTGLHCLWMKSKHAGQWQTQLLIFGAATHISKQRWTYTKI